MPTMNATNTPQAAATARSRRGRGVRIEGVDVSFMRVASSQGPPHDARSELDDGEDVEQQHQRAQDERERDRAGAAAPLLLLGEHDAIAAIVIHLRDIASRSGPS